MRFGIAFRLGLLLAGVGVLAAGATGYYAYSSSRQLLIGSTKNELLTSTQVLARRITITRQEVSRNLLILARHPAALAALHSPDSGQAEQLTALFELMMEANPAYFQIRLISAGDYGRERVRVDRDTHRLMRIRGDELQEKGHYPYVYDTLRLPEGRTYLSRIVINHERGAHAGLEQPTALLAMPVAGREGTALGVVVINVDLNGVFALLAADLPKGYQLFFANDKGDFLIHPDSSRTFGFDKGRRILIQDEFPATRDLVEGRRYQVLTEAGDGPYAQAPVVAAFIGHMPLVARDENGYILGLAQPLSTVLQQTHKLGSTTLQIVLGLSLICILLAMLIARALTRPINSMSSAVQRFANKNQRTVLTLKWNDEIGMLARSFNLMQDQITRQLTELQESRQELEHLARHDMLTGLPNRRLLQDRLEQALARARRNTGRVTLLFIDLDDFKEVNDRLGHDAGDAVLKEIASRLNATVREVDTVARLGGDEFVILLDDSTPSDHVAAVSQKILESIKAAIPLHGQVVQISASIGISQYPNDGETGGELLAQADQAMYKAKVEGPGGIRFPSSSVSSPPADSA